MLAILAQNLTTVDGALKAPEYAIDRFIFANFDANAWASQGTSVGLV